MKNNIESIFNDQQKLIEYLESYYDSLREIVINDPRGFLNVVCNKNIQELLKTNDHLLERYRDLKDQAIVSTIEALNRESTSPDERIKDPHLLKFVEDFYKRKASYLDYIKDVSSTKNLSREL